MRLRELLSEAKYDPNVVGSGIVVDPNYKQPPVSKKAKPAAPATPAKSSIPSTPVAPKLGTTKPPVAPITTPAPKLNAVAPKEPPHFNPGEHIDLLTKMAKARGISTANDLSNFLGQCKVETANFTKAAENFMYSDPVRIYKVFTSKFKNSEEAKPYVNNPVALANRALGGKNGNGDEASGDGWRFRGRGFIHLTGRELYAQAGALAHPDKPNIYVTNPELLSSNPKEAAAASIAYFKSKVGLGKTTKQTTKVVNPAGLKSKERVAATQQMKKQIAATAPATRPGQAATPKPKK
jgi:putative chitinase